MNAMIFGFSFFLDNELHIKHLPPAKSHPMWMRLREDIYRFVFEREKLRHQKKVQGMRRLSAEDFGEYPGAFLKEDLDERIKNASMLLSGEYRRNGDIAGGIEALKNIHIAFKEAVPSFNPFDHLVELQKNWEQMMAHTSQDKIAQGIRETFANGRKLS
ncbi:MAG: hypothetical protein PWR29_817 [Methanolobus sp.]|nr:hypothetical protein [Methanolobus sp.]